jgi:hypothetical protein
MARKEIKIMLRRSVIIAISAVLGSMLGPLDTSASGTSQFGGSVPRNGSEIWIAGSRWSGQGHWSKKERRNAYWAFYDDLRFYAAPEYYVRCYRRTRIETIYGVVWRPVRICD